MLSVFSRGMIKLPTSTEIHVPKPRADEIKVSFYEVNDELIKARTLRGLKNHISEEKAEEEICEEVVSKAIALLHSNGAHMIRTKGEHGKEKEIKSVLLDIEDYILKTSQKIIHAENVSPLDILEIFSGVLEKIENFYQENLDIHVSGLQDYFEDMSEILLSFFDQTKETAEVPQISEIELD